MTSDPQQSAAERKSERYLPSQFVPRRTPFTAKDHPHCWAAFVYARDVVQLRIAACKEVQQACERFLRDLELAQRSAKLRPFFFDADKAERICRFVEKLPHVKGREWAGKNIRLEPWQCFVYVNPFGFYLNNGRRRFRTVLVLVPRKNSKTTMSAPVGLYGLVADGEPGSEVYSAATTRDQAKISWDIAAMMVRKRASMARHFGIRLYRQLMSVAEDGSVFRPLSSDAHNLDGLNTHIGIVDELHAHKTRDAYDVIESSMGARDQPLLWLISTAGSNQNGICYEQYTYLKKILDGAIEDDSYFGVIYTVDEHDDWTSPETWRKANPNFGISVNPEMLSAHCKKAQASPAAQSNFKTKYLNVWVGAEAPWMNMQAWRAAARPGLRREDFAGLEFVCAFDLASKIDFAARVDVCRKRNEETGNWSYALFSKFWLPEQTILDATNPNYRRWVQEGHVIQTPGNIIDFEEIEQEMIEDRERIKIAEVPYDPFQATEFSTRLQKDHFPMIEVRPTVLNFSEPMKALEALVLSGALVHDNNPVMNWMVSNVVCVYDRKDNVYPRKEHPANKIDGPVAAIMAMNRWVANESRDSIYLTRGVLFV